MKRFNKLYLIIIICCLFNSEEYPQEITWIPNNLYFIEDSLLFISHAQLTKNNYSANNSIATIDSITSTNVQGSSFKYSFTYYPFGKVREMIGYYFVQGNWNTISKREFFYDSNFLMIRELLFDKNIATWDTSSQIIYEYDIAERLSKVTYQIFTTEIWTNILRSTYEYDKFDRITNTLTEFWENNQWVNASLINTFYTLEGNRDSVLIREWIINNWQNNFSYKFSYNKMTGYLINFSSKIWLAGQWINNTNTKILNDVNGNQIEHLEEIWVGNKWENSFRTSFNYNFYNLLEYASVDKWNGSNWIPGENAILVEIQDDYSIGFITHSVIVNYLIISVDEEKTFPSEFKLSQNYPNPFNPFTKIKYQIPESGLVTIKVYDILGSEIVTLVNEELSAGEYEIEFDGRKLTSGIYFYKLQAGDFVETKKMILMK